MSEKIIDFIKKPGVIAAIVALALACVVLLAAKHMEIAENLLQLVDIVLSPAVIIIGFAVWFVNKYEQEVRKFLAKLQELSIFGEWIKVTASVDTDSPEETGDDNISNADKPEIGKTDSENPEDIFRRGVMLANAGRQSEAVDMYLRAAKLNYPPAQNTMGARYAKGWGVPENQEEAVKWFSLAAEQKYARAQNNLGVRYARGRGVPKNQEEAAKWYRRAAEQNLPTAQDNYGDMCAMNAFVWYTIAAENGHPSAVKMRDKMRGVLSEDGLEKAANEIARLREKMAENRK